MRRRRGKERALARTIASASTNSVLLPLPFMTWTSSIQSAGPGRRCQMPMRNSGVRGRSSMDEMGER